MSAPPPHGIIVPVPTFFEKKSSPSYKVVSSPLDTETQIAHAVFLAKAGIKAIVLLGSTGEAVHITRSERKALINAVRDGLAANGFPDFPLIAGTATNSVDETVELLTESKEAGASWGLVLAPGYFAAAMNQEGVEAWYTAVADRSPIPIMIYHFPAVSNNVKILPSTIRAIAAHPNVVGAKFSHGDVSVHAQVALDPRTDHSRFALFTGLGQHLFPAVQVGCAGAIDGLANFFPASVVRLYNLAAADTMGRVEREEARKLQWAISGAEELVTKWGTVGIKEGVARVCGFGDTDGTRLPLKGGIPGGDEEWRKWGDIIKEMQRLEEAAKSVSGL